jgi:hypothetical protein
LPGRISTAHAAYEPEHVAFRSRRPLPHVIEEEARGVLERRGWLRWLKDGWCSSHSRGPEAQPRPSRADPRQFTSSQQAEKIGAIDDPILLRPRQILLDEPFPAKRLAYLAPKPGIARYHRRVGNRLAVEPGSALGPDLPIEGRIDKVWTMIGVARARIPSRAYAWSR